MQSESMVSYKYRPTKNRATITYPLISHTVYALTGFLYIPQSGHGATPYFGGVGPDLYPASSVVFDPNCIEFPTGGFNPMGARHSRTLGMQHNFY